MKYIILLLLCFAGASATFAQANDTSIFTTLQADRTVRIIQERSIEETVRAGIERNRYRKAKGYRVRLFFGNEQHARQRSFTIAMSFAAEHPEVAVYHSFEDLYFRVAVGDFRTRSEAMRFLMSIKAVYPSAFVIACPVNYLPAQRDRERVIIEETEPEDVE
ncbi:MAG: SPOR domain-containing protein [Prevotellaceae bacterium]|jgi:hypothetical protein|nr:SPOR domain-containing protein [Prevotellaceae bacterium]